MRNNTPDSEADAANLQPSKTQLKKQSHGLQSLGEALAALPDDKLDRLQAEGALGESLRDALREYKRTRSHEGRRRQMQYVGKLMRQADEQALREVVDAAQLPRARDTLALHEAERWREELAVDDAALTRWMARYPASDLQHLRSLLRAARKEAALPPEQRHGRSWRELFQFIKRQLQETQEAPPDGDE